MKRYLFLPFILLFLLSIPLFSIETIYSEDTEPIYYNKVSEGDLLIAGETITFSGEAEDVTLAGTDIFFLGKSELSAHTFAKEITIDGQIGNDLIGAAKTVKINGIIEDTLIVAGKTIIISEGAVINGDILAAASEIIIRGTVNGNLFAGARVVTIDTRIEGNAKIGAGKIEFTEKGYIAGDLNYWTNKELNTHEKAKIGGNSVYEENSKGFGKDGEFDFEKGGEQFAQAISIAFRLISILATLIGGLLVLCLPYFRKLEEEKSDKNVLNMFLFGLIPFFIYPALTIVLAILVITLPLAGILALAAVPIMFITQVIGITLLGQYLFKRFNWKKDSRFLFFLFGLVFFTILGLIPFVSFLALIFFSSLGWGYILEKLFQKRLA